LMEAEKLNAQLLQALKSLRARNEESAVGRK
jgi:hypothetical protein